MQFKIEPENDCCVLTVYFDDGKRASFSFPKGEILDQLLVRVARAHHILNGKPEPVHPFLYYNIMELQQAYDQGIIKDKSELQFVGFGSPEIKS